VTAAALAALSAARDGAREVRLWCQHAAIATAHLPAVGLVKLAGAVIVTLALLATARPAERPSAMALPVSAPTIVNAPSEMDRGIRYTWLSHKERGRYVPLAERIAPPAGFRRVATTTDSFADWLRHLPVLPAGSPVKSHKEEVVLAGDHPNLAAVIALQPHAPRLLDATAMMIRLRGEYAWTRAGGLGARFHFDCGDRLSWMAWASGVRPRAEERRVGFRQVLPADTSRASYCAYLETVFYYGSSQSLLDDTRPAEDGRVAIGDVLLLAGSNGHALIVLDVVLHASGEVRALLGQGGTPPQTLHVLQSDAGDPWFGVTDDMTIDLGERGVMRLDDLRHWAD